MLEVLVSVCPAKVFEFPVAAVTNEHILSGLKEHIYSITVLEVRV